MSRGVSGAAQPPLPPAGRVGEWLRAAASDPASLPDEGYESLLGADGPQLEELCRLADGLRHEAVGDTLTYVVNRNLDTAAVAGADPASRQRLATLVAEARELGATEICMQGPLPAPAPGLPAPAPGLGPAPAQDGDDYLDLIAAIQAAAPGIHLHAFRPPELLDGAARRGLPLEKFLTAAQEAGLGSVPGTAARILDDGVRARMRGGADLPVSQWTEVIEAAHRAGLKSTSTMVFGHIETPAHQVAHLRLLADIQDRTGGFTEFIAMPFVPATAAITAPGLASANAANAAPASGAPTNLGPNASADPAPAPNSTPSLPGPSWRQTRAVHAVARLMLHGRIANIQAAWPKFGLDASVDLLRSGANDLGGLLLDGRLAPDAGAEAGLVLTLDDVTRVARQLGRPLRQRTTSYGEVPAGE